MAYPHKSNANIANVLHADDFDTFDDVLVGCPKNGLRSNPQIERSAVRVLHAQLVDVPEERGEVREASSRAVTFLAQRE